MQHPLSIRSFTALRLCALLLAAALPLSLAACGSDDGAGGTGPATDSGAAAADSASTAGADGATSEDAASTDAGASEDATASASDAASTDAGTADAGTADAGTADAGPPPAAKYVSRTPAQVKALLAKQPRPKLINVHVPFAGEIVGTDAHIIYTDIDALEAYLGHDKGAFAVLYCLTGPMSYSAVKALVKRGYWNLIDMPAGMAKWKSLGYPYSKTKASK